MNRLARAICPALGRQEEINGRCSGPTLDAPVREIEFRLAQAEESEVVPLLDGDHRRRCASTPGDKVSGEMHAALAVAVQFRQHPVRLGDEAHACVLDRRGIGQGPHDHVNAIGAGQGRNPHVRDEEPLGCRGLIAPLGAGNAGLQRIKPRPERGQNLAHRQAGGDILVQPVVDLTHALPHGFGHLAFETGQFPCVERPPEVILLQRADEVPVGHGIEGQRNLVGVDRNDRQRSTLDARQNIGPPREAQGGRPVPHIEPQRRGVAQGFTRGGGQTGPQGDLIALPMLNARNAELPPLRVDRQARNRGLQEIRMGHAACQRFGEDRADARFGGIVFNAGRGHAEPIEPDRAVKLGLKRLGRGFGDRQAQRRDHVAPPVVVLQGAGQQKSGIGQLLSRLSPKGRVGGGDQGGAGHAALLGAVADLSFEGQPGIFHPVRRIVGDCDCRPVKTHGLQELPFCETGLGGIQNPLCRPGARVVAPGQGIGLSPCRGQIVGAQEGQLFHPPVQTRQDSGIGVAHRGRHGPVIGLHRQNVRLRETCAVSCVERECGAVRISKAGTRASDQSGVIDRGQISARKIGVLSDREEPLGNGCGLGQHRNG